MKYKVGDKVKIKENLVARTNYGEADFADNMCKYKGKEAIVKKRGSIFYRLDIDGETYLWTDEMLEPVEEMSAEEAIKLSGEMCSSSACYECPVFKSREKYSEMCNVFRKEHAEEYLEILKQWKADHEKKPIETEFIYIVRIIEDKQCVHEEEIVGESEDEACERVLKKYCEDHKGKFYAVAERICRVKE